MPNIVKNTTFPGLLDLISPHSCRGCGRIGTVLCECCKNYILKDRRAFCPQCKNKLPATTSSCPNCLNLPPIYVVSNRNGLLGTLIHDYKYYSIRALAKPLAEFLDTILPANLPKSSILVPLPTATHHIRSRGLDHTYLIAKHLAKARHIPVKKLLTRNKNTVQVGSDRGKRLTQASSAYQLTPKAKISSNATYILLDDIWTTGASVTASQKILRQAGARDIIIALLAYST